MASEMVMAVGDYGITATPRQDCIGVSTAPLAQGNVVTPATMRDLATHPAGGYIPTKLIEILPPDPTMGRRHVKVRFQCTPIRQYRAGGAAFYVTTASCAVRNLADALDPLWHALADDEREQIALAVEART